MMSQAIQKWVNLAFLSATAVALSFLEGLLIPFLPFGIKPGLSNIATMFTARRYGLAAALIIALFKACFALLTRGGVAFLMSLCGGLLSAFLTGLLLRRPRKRIGTVGISVLGALLHNTAQWFVSWIILGDAAVALVPMLLLSACAAGVVTGVVLHLTVAVVDRRIYHKK